MDLALLGIRVTADTSEVEEKLPKVTAQVAETSNAAADAAEQYNQFNAALRTPQMDVLTQKISFQQRSLAILESELGQLTATEGVNQLAVDRKRLAIDQLNVAIASNVASLNRQESELHDSSAAIAANNQQLDNAQKELNETNSELGKTTSVWGRFKEGLSLGAGLSVFNELTGGVKALATNIIGIGTDYQTSMSLLQASSSATDSEMAQLSATTKALGSDMSLPGTSASDAAQAMLELNKAGLSVNDTMAASKGVLQLSAAAQVDNATAAVMVGDALNTFNLKGTEAIHVADLLAGSANSASGEISDFSASLQQVGSVAAQAQIPIETTMAMIALLAKNGIKGSDAGTSAKTFIQRLQSQTEEAKDAIEGLNVTIYDSAGAMRPMADIIDQFSTSLGKLTAEDRGDALNTIFGSDAVRAAGILFKEGASGLDLMTDSITRSGSASKMAEAQMQGLGGAWQGFQSQLETAALNGIEPLLPILEDLVLGLANVAGWVSEHIGPAMTDFATGLRIVYDAGVTVFDWIDQNATAIITTLGLAFAGAGIALVGFAGPAAIAGISLVGLGQGIAIAAGSALLAAAPFVALGIALGGLWMAGQKFQELSQEVHDGSLQVLETKEWWNQATNAVNDYGANAAGMSDTTKAIAQSLNDQQEKLFGLTQQYALGLIGYEEYIAQAEPLKESIKGTTGALNEAITVEHEHNQLIGESLQATRALRNEYEELGNSASGSASGSRNLMQSIADVNVAMDALDADKAKEFAKAFQSIEEEGAQAFGELTNSTVGFFTEREQRQAAHTQKMAELNQQLNDATTQTQEEAIGLKIQKEQESYALQEQNAAISYAHQREEQRRHLGEMFLDWINNQAMLLTAAGTMTPELQARFSALTGHVTAEYGLMADSVGLGFVDTLGHYQNFLNGTIQGTDELGAATQKTEDHFAKVATRAQELERTYVTELELRREGLTPEEYNRELDAIRRKVYTEAELDISNTETEAARAQEVIDRVPNDIRSKIFLDANEVDPIAGAATRAIESVPDEHTTILKVDATSGEAEAYSAGANFVAGMAAGMEANIYMVANAAQKTAATAASATRGYLQIQSPSRVMVEMGRFVPAGLALGIEEMGHLPANAMLGISNSIVDSQRGNKRKLADAGGQTVEGFTEGIEEHADEPMTALAKGIIDGGAKVNAAMDKTTAKILKEEEAYLKKFEANEREYIEKVGEIWTEFYEEQQAQLDAFNSDKFDSQLSFYDSIADLDSEARNRAYEEQRAAWDESQAIAAEKGGAIADEWYQRNLEIIEADEQRAQRIIGIDQDLADKRKALAEASTEEERQRIAAEIAELESRKQFLEDVDKQQDQRDKDQLEAIKNQNNELETERDEALGDARTDFEDTNAALVEGLRTSVDSIIESQEQQRQAHESFAAAIVASYDLMIQAAESAAAAGPAQDDGNAGVDGSHAMGLDFVPPTSKGFYRADLHEGEAVLNRTEATVWRAQRESQGTSSGVAVVAAGEVTNVYNTFNVYPQTKLDIEDLAYRVSEIQKRKKR